MAALKKELIEGRVTLEKAAKKCGIRGQVWWAAAGDRKGSKSREVNAVQEEESPAIQAIMKGMEAMQVTVAALAAAQTQGGVNSVDTDKPKTKEETEIEKLRAENKRLRSTHADGNWEQRYRPKGKGDRPKGKGKGPAQGCFKCGGPHYQNQCPQWQRKGYWGGRGGGYGGGYGKCNYSQGGGGYGSKGSYGGYSGGQPWQGGQQQQPQAPGTPNQNNQNQAIVPVNSVEQHNGAHCGTNKPKLASPSQVMATSTTGPSAALATTAAGELARDTLLYPQYLWAQAMGRQLAQPQQEVPPTGPGMQEGRPDRKEESGQKGQGEGETFPSPTSWCPALHHTGTGAARCQQREGSEAAAPLLGLPGTSEGPARLV